MMNQLNSIVFLQSKRRSQSSVIVISIVPDVLQSVVVTLVKLAAKVGSHLPTASRRMLLEILTLRRGANLSWSFERMRLWSVQQQAPHIALVMSVSHWSRCRVMT